MIEKICIYLTKKIQEKMPEVDDERAEVINYGLQLVIGEIPKIFLLIAIAFILRIGWLTLLAFILILPYKMFSGGFHLKTHIGCIIGTTVFYCGDVLLSKSIVLDSMLVKILVILAVWIFGMIMVKLYAPADTENVPIISKKERKKQKNLSYIILTISLIIALFIKDSVISNIIIFGMLIQSISISRLAYKLTNNKYGYEVYCESNIQNEVV